MVLTFSSTVSPPQKEVCREHGISDATYYTWKSRFGGIEAADVRRLKQMYADLSLENRALKDVIAKKL